MYWIVGHCNNIEISSRGKTFFATRYLETTSTLRDWVPKVIGKNFCFIKQAFGNKHLKQTYNLLLNPIIYSQETKHVFALDVFFMMFVWVLLGLTSC